MTLQPPAVLFPDAETVACTYLRTALAARSEPYAAGVVVASEKPTEATSPYPARVVVVRRDGGLQRGVFDYPRLTVRVWCNDRDDATDLALLVRALLVVSPGHAGIVRADPFSGPQGVPDDGPQTQKFFAVELQMRGTDF